QDFEYPDLRITTAHSYFYSFAMQWCGSIQWSDKHSPNNIRVNGRVSQMPEFSEAFGCKKGDTLFSEPDKVCHLFGEKSTGAKVNAVKVERDEVDGIEYVIESLVLEGDIVDVVVEGSGEYGQANDDSELLTNEVWG
ncbi:hypothetical protein PENTCL1PPCAC_21663, partial [Pristionchus entomophagus]